MRAQTRGKDIGCFTGSRGRCVRDGADPAILSLYLSNLLGTMRKDACPRRVVARFKMAEISPLLGELNEILSQPEDRRSGLEPLIDHDQPRIVLCQDT